MRDTRRLAAIVSIDVAGYSRLMGLDDSGTLAALKAHRRELIDPKIAEYGGRIVKTIGDGLLVEFPSVVDAVRSAVDVQRGMAERNAGVPAAKRLDFRIGVNVGDIIIDDDDIFGDGVNVASRLQGLAQPGGICASRVVRDQVLDKLSFAFEDLGAQHVKNIARPVDVFRIDLGSGASAPVFQGALTTTLQRVTQGISRPARSTKLLFAVIVIAGLGIAAWTVDRAYLHPSSVVAYSAQDRRMTFAVLPFQARADDNAASEVAAAISDAVFALEERKLLWALVASRASVEQAVSQRRSSKDVASALDVHFLIRGNVSRAPLGYAVEVLVIDGATERVIDTRTVVVAAPVLTSRDRRDLEDLLGGLTYKALEVEVQRTRDKSDPMLDVRDLSFRAYVDWGNSRQQDPKAAYLLATSLLNRALAKVPDDLLALYLTARVNLCDCVEGWSHNVEEQQAIGAAAMEKYLRRVPDSASMLTLKSELYALQGRFEESLLLADAVLKREPDDTEALADKAYALLKLDRTTEAATAIDDVLDRRDRWPETALAAAIRYQLGQYDRAAQAAQKVMTQMNREEASNHRSGAVALTLVAAEARLGHLPRAKVALSDFYAAVPGVRTLSEIRRWMHPAADLAGYEPLFDGLHLAGVSD